MGRKRLRRGEGNSEQSKMWVIWGEMGRGGDEGGRDGGSEIRKKCGINDFKRKSEYGCECLVECG
jgi:hypothetical protein